MEKRFALKLLFFNKINAFFIRNFCLELIIFAMLPSPPQNNHYRQSSMDNFASYTKYFISLAIIPTMVILIYANTFNSPFHFDDRGLIQDNPAIHDLFDPDRAMAFNRHRPLTMISLAFSYHFNGTNVFGYHLFNILLHSLSTTLLLTICILLLRPMRRRKTFSKAVSTETLLFAVLFYAVQPTNIEAVTYICGRSSLLATFLLLVSFFLFTKSKLCGFFIWKITYVGAAILFYILSIASKEIGVVLPVILLASGYYFFFIPGNDKIQPSSRFLKYLKAEGLYLLPFFLIIMMLFALRYYAQGAFIEKNSAYLTMYSWSSYVFTQINVVSYYYLNKLFFPVNQNVDIYFPVIKSFFNIPTFFAIVFFFYLVFIAFKKRFLSIWLFFAVLWFFVTLSPTSSFIPITDVAVERRLYLPGISLSFLLLHILSGQSTRVMFLLISVLMIFSTNSVMRNALFTQETSLWMDAVQKSPGKARPHNNLGDVYNKFGRYEEAAAELKESIRIKPDYTEARYNLGVVYGRMGLPQEALREFKMAKLLRFSAPDLYYNLGVLYADLGLFEKAMEEYKIALNLNPEHDRAHNNLGVIYTGLDRHREALKEYMEAVRLNPTYHEARNNLGSAYQRIGRHQDAIRQFQIVLKLKPDYYQGHYNLGVIYYQQGKTEKALEAWETVLKIDPNFQAARESIEKVTQGSPTDRQL